jgi:hypothetical protein
VLSREATTWRFAGGFDACTAHTLSRDFSTGRSPKSGVRATGDNRGCYARAVSGAADATSKGLYAVLRVGHDEVAANGD